MRFEAAGFRGQGTARRRRTRTAQAMDQCHCGAPPTRLPAAHGPTYLWGPTRAAALRGGCCRSRCSLLPPLLQAWRWRCRWSMREAARKPSLCWTCCSPITPATLARWLRVERPRRCWDSYRVRRRARAPASASLLRVRKPAPALSCCGEVCGHPVVLFLVAVNVFSVCPRPGGRKTRKGRKENKKTREKNTRKGLPARLPARPLHPADTPQRRWSTSPLPSRTSRASTTFTSAAARHWQVRTAEAAAPWASSLPFPPVAPGWACAAAACCGAGSGLPSGSQPTAKACWAHGRRQRARLLGPPRPLTARPCA